MQKNIMQPVISFKTHVHVLLMTKILGLWIFILALPKGVQLNIKENLFICLDRNKLTLLIKSLKQNVPIMHFATCRV